MRLMNTIWADRSDIHDSLTSHEQLVSWTRQCGYADPEPPAAAHLTRTRTLRDTLRSLAAEAVADDRPGAVNPDITTGWALAQLAEFTHHATPRLERAGETGAFTLGWDLHTDGYDRFLTTIAVQATTMLTESADRLSACHGPGCVLYFFRTHGRREWCSATCGNRARVARHYKRHKKTGHAQHG